MASCNIPAAFATDASILEDLKASKVKLEPIPDLLEQKEWDKVRSILKVPPVNKLWNLGDVSCFLFARFLVDLNDQTIFLLFTDITVSSCSRKIQ